LLQSCAAITSVTTCTTVSTSSGVTPGTAVTYCATIPSVTTCATVSTSTGITPGTAIPYCAAITSVTTCATVSTSTGVTPGTAVHSIPYGRVVQSLLCWEFNDKITCHRYNRCSDGKHDDEDDEVFQGVRLLSFSHILITSP
jgi:hypothetical protein